MAKKALFVVGGWLGHTPHESSALFAGILEAEGYEVEISESLDSYLDVEKLKQLDLIVPAYTMSTITDDQVAGLLAAVESGVGVGGWH
ncbi:ThuA domain-containing protein [Chloroflexota bacterium]